ncbi:hypothetical protein GCM10011352_30350 [Marinobacterium zhoushanense]|uniref:General secretion pathway protein L n=1 Tax=Marinobacterium zhoushanense TaxID=1679163 RepID=A0ABQ1KJ83_9GAMM|nr:PilN domain-containing protein [Marinobacterium zhoushanense]GGC02084.1 hypothetical protein GCM10011352_30350 [Marinobacterium zhoushanense]
MKSEPFMRMNSGWRSLVATVKSFWLWWSGELSVLMPAQLSRKMEGRERILHFSSGSFETKEGGQLLRIPLDRAGSDPTLATWRTLDAGKIGLLVTIDPKDLLHKVISLPAATESRLDSVIGFELDRHTPFNASQASFGYRIVKHDRTAQRLEVELFVLPNTVLERINGALEESGLRPSAILPAVSVGDNRARSSLNLLPEHQQPKAQRRALLRSRPVIVVLLVSLVIAVLFYQREERLAELQEMAGPRQAVAEQAQTVREAIEALESGGRYLYERKTARPATLILLDELTTLLPDDTWLSRFELEGDELRVQGESTSASGLIGLLEQSPLFEQVSFTSPVTINPRSQKERFSLMAKVVGEETP